MSAEAKAISSVMLFSHTGHLHDALIAFHLAAGDAPTHAFTGVRHVLGCEQFRRLCTAARDTWAPAGDFDPADALMFVAEAPGIDAGAAHGLRSESSKLRRLYAAMSTEPEVVRALVAAGWDPSTPAGASASHRACWVATLDRIRPELARTMLPWTALAELGKRPKLGPLAKGLTSVFRTARKRVRATAVAQVVQPAKATPPATTAPRRSAASKAAGRTATVGASRTSRTRPASPSSAARKPRLNAVLRAARWPAAAHISRALTGSDDGFNVAAFAKATSDARDSLVAEALGGEDPDEALARLAPKAPPGSGSTLKELMASLGRVFDRV